MILRVGVMALATGCGSFFQLGPRPAALAGEWVDSLSTSADDTVLRTLSPSGADHSVHLRVARTAPELPVVHRRATMNGTWYVRGDLADTMRRELCVNRRPGRNGATCRPFRLDTLSTDRDGAVRRRLLLWSFDDPQRAHTPRVLLERPAAPAARPPGSEAPPADSGDLINPDRPGIADGSRVIGEHQWQFEVGVQYERRKADADVRTTTTLAPALLRLGLSKQLEARIETNSVTSLETDAPVGDAGRVTGYSPVSIGVKYQAFDSGGDGRRSVGIIGRLFPSSGSADFRNANTTGDVRIAADWDFAPHLSVNPNVGLGVEQADGGGTFTAALGALTLNYLPTERINPFVDVGAQAPEARHGRASVILDSGLAYIVGRNVQLDVSAGRGVHGTTPPRPFVAVGVSFRT
jgi:hypothetical protein